MAVSSGRARTTDLNHKMQIQIPKKWKDRDQTSPERTKVWTEPKHKPKTDRKVSVVYYLSRNGQLEHPHFLEVPLSPSSDGLYLRGNFCQLLNFSLFLSLLESENGDCVSLQM
ncbi:Protein SOSEKI [Dillenia turbinata]|uniref:Protein SOSEKI n=1 Tax=Dillenia turbinata TaxID=194707 RepID=A0AAN8VUC0_9MAGN